MIPRLETLIRRTALLGAAFAFLAGCASPLVFDERTNGQEAEVIQGRVFQVSLPASSPRPGSKEAPAWGDPELGGPLVILLGRRHDAQENRDIFEFRAEKLGEGEIRFRKVTPEARREAGSYSLRLRVKPADEPRILTAPTH